MQTVYFRRCRRAFMRSGKPPPVTTWWRWFLKRTRLSATSFIGKSRYMPPRGFDVCLFHGRWMVFGSVKLLVFILAQNAFRCRTISSFTSLFFANFFEIALIVCAVIDGCVVQAFFTACCHFVILLFVFAFLCRINENVIYVVLHERLFIVFFMYFCSKSAYLRNSPLVCSTMYIQFRTVLFMCASSGLKSDLIWISSSKFCAERTDCIFTDFFIFKGNVFSILLSVFALLRSSFLEISRNFDGTWPDPVNVKCGV